MIPGTAGGAVLCSGQDVLVPRFVFCARGCFAGKWPASAVPGMYSVWNEVGRGEEEKEEEERQMRKGIGRERGRGLERERRRERESD